MSAFREVDRIIRWSALAGLSIHNAAWASLIGLGAGTGMQWWWNEVDALNVYYQLTGPSQLITKVLAPLLLKYNWTIYNDATTSPAEVNAGWTVGWDAAGQVCAALYFVYNRNHTWSRRVPVIKSHLLIFLLALIPQDAHWCGVAHHHQCHHNATQRAAASRLSTLHHMVQHHHWAAPLRTDTASATIFIFAA